MRISNRNSIIFALTLFLTGPLVGVLAQTHVCRACKGEISGQWVTTNTGEYYHPQHFTCAHCGKPIEGSYVVYEDGNYHNRCYDSAIAQRCAVCSNILSGQYIVDYWGNSYHASHEAEFDQCTSCSRLICPRLTGGGVSYPDGRHVCTVCGTDALTDADSARGLMRATAAEMSRFGMDVDCDELELHLIDRRELDQVSAGLAQDARGYTDYRERKTMFGLVTRQTVNLYMLVGLPHDEARSVLAHELAHVWQYRRGRLHNDPALCEGSCNYASFLILNQQETELSRYLTDMMGADDDPNYGEGFRRIRRFADERGVPAWLDWLSANDDFPENY